MEREHVQPPSSPSDDWIGTATAEQSVIVHSNDLYELAGLDPNRWSILGLDMYAFSHGDPPRWNVHVYAFDRNREDGEVNSHEGLKQLEAKRGSVPVTDILLHNVSFEDIVRSMKVIHLQLLSRNFAHLDIVDRADHPVQA